MQKIFLLLLTLIFLFTYSCTSTGVMGLATEEAMIKMDQKQEAELAEIKSTVEEINKLIDRLEVALEEAEQAKTNAKEALVIFQETATESIKLSQEIESVKELILEIEGRIDSMPEESIEKLIEILQEYVKSREELEIN